MSCCGQNRSRPALGASAPPPAMPRVEPTRAPHLRVVFEYLGATALTVVGPVSGRRYHFSATGARIPIDPRDRPGVARVPKLRQVT